jgi:1-acyl-sn-glycerol-3-phosphate acyltransferase
VIRFSSGDGLRYEAISPRPSLFWNWVMKGYRNNFIRKTHNVSGFVYEEIDRLRGLVGSDARILIAPNHSDNADGLVLYRLAEEVDSMFCQMATRELFEGNFGFRHFIFPRCGIFPIDREGSVLGALKSAKDVLVRIAKPLVVYPEGEVYHTNDRLTPLREGAAAMALTSQKALKDKAPVYIVPVALKYHYLDPEAAMAGLAKQLTGLESRFKWVAKPEESISRRIYRFASGLLALKEVEFLGSPGSGTVPDRVENLRDKLLERLENRHLGKLGSGELPDRISMVHRRIVERIKEEEATDETRRACRRDLDLTFIVVQLFSYPGDYIHEYPTVERIGETLLKFEQDLGDGGYVTPVSARQLTFRIGEPIDTREYVNQKSREAVRAMTDVLSERLQKALDEIGPGTHIKDLKG